VERGVRIVARLEQVSALAAHRITDVAAGNAHALALASDGLVCVDRESMSSSLTPAQLYAWGNNMLGQCGLGHSDPVHAPQRVRAEPVVCFLVDGFCVGAILRQHVREKRFGRVLSFGRGRRVVQTKTANRQTCNEYDEYTHP
jgi:alpha-tubulin suppressor-like RCC1 family protein